MVKRNLFSSFLTHTSESSLYPSPILLVTRLLTHTLTSFIWSHSFRVHSFIYSRIRVFNYISHPPTIQSICLSHPENFYIYMNWPLSNFCMLYLGHRSYLNCFRPLSCIQFHLPYSVTHIHARARSFSLTEWSVKIFLVLSAAGVAEYVFKGVFSSLSTISLFCTLRLASGSS